MSTKNKTKNLKLPQYQNDDLFDMKEVNEAYKIIDESYKEQNDNYKQAIETSTINGAIDNLELIDARKGKRTLGEKISEIDEELDNIVYIAKNKDDIGLDVNNAIDKGYRTIKIPHGEYVLKTSIILSDFVEIYGDKNTVLKRNIDKPFITSSNMKLTNECYIHDLCFISDTITGNINYDLHLCNVNMCKIERIKIQGLNVNTTSKIGLYVYKENESTVGSAYSINLDKLDFRNASLVIGITDSYLTNSNIWSHDLSNCVWLQTSSHQVLNCQFVGNDVSGALRVEHPSGSVLELIKVNNCYFDGSYVDVESGNAIYLKNVYSSIITSNNIWKQKKNGLILEGCDSVIISNNSFRDNGISDDKAYTDISFKGGCANCIVSDNTFLSTELERTFKTLAIDLSQATTVVNSVFKNNLVRDTTNYNNTPFNFDEDRLESKGNVFMNNKKGESQNKAHSNKIIGDIDIRGKLLNKNGMLINFNFFKDDFNPSIPQEVENGTKRRSTVVTKNGVINGLAYNINAPLTNSTTTVDVNINGVKKSEISIPNNKYSDYVLLSSPLTVLKGQAISLTLRSSGNDQTLRQIQFTVEYEIN